MCTKDVACAFSAELGENQRQHIPAPDNLAHSRCLTGGADIIDNKADGARWLKNFLFHVALWIGAHRGSANMYIFFLNNLVTLQWPGQWNRERLPKVPPVLRRAENLDN